MSTKNILIAVIVILLVILGFYFFSSESNDYTKEPIETMTTEDVSVEAVPEATPEEEVVAVRGPVSDIGTSVGGSEIKAYHFGTGEEEILFIGGIHGGYSWNTALLGFEIVDWLKANEAKIPENLTVTVIPVLNPDGLSKVTGGTGRFAAADVNKSEATRTAGRFNGNNVDLNRNFNCEWQSVGTWQNKDVSGGTAPFSEPESEAINDYVNGNKPTAVVTWYSAAGGVYSSECKAGVLPETIELTNLFAKASGYKAFEEFDYYEITGDMVNWFAGQGVPAISVLLTNHTDTELNKNIAGVEAVLNFYAE